MATGPDGAFLVFPVPRYDSAGLLVFVVPSSTVIPGFDVPLQCQAQHVTRDTGTPTNPCTVEVTHLYWDCTLDALLVCESFVSWIDANLATATSKTPCFDCRTPIRECWRHRPI